MALIHCFYYVPDILHVASRLILQHEKLYYSHFIKKKKFKEVKSHSLLVAG